MCNCNGSFYGCLCNHMVNPGSDPHIYEPRPEQMKNLEKSDIFFAVGMEYENNWLPKFAKNYPNLDIVKTQKNVQMLSSIDHKHNDHHHYHHKEHKKSYDGIFDDKDIKDRDISDWNGEYNSIYPYLLNGSFDIGAAKINAYVHSILLYATVIKISFCILYGPASSTVRLPSIA